VPRHQPAINSAARLLAILALGAAAIVGALYWKARRVPAPSMAAAAAAGLLPATADRDAPEAVSDIAAAPAPTAAESNRIEIDDVAARVAAAYAAGNAKAAAEHAAAPDPPELPLAEVISQSLPAVVRVETGDSLGSGFFIAPDTILTNVHVVGANALVTVRRAGGAVQQARVESSAPHLDIAVVKIGNPNPDQPTLPLGSASRVRAGQEVVALGSPLGLTNTVTRGIVSAVRQVGSLTLVQTDAAINPGNSGGPLIDRTGRVIGITTLGMRSAVAQGLSFAIAIEHAQAVLGGRRSADATGTPLTALNEAMIGGRAAGEADSERARASTAYEQAVAKLAQTANALDDRWRTFVRSCYSGDIAGGFDRPWFALWEPHAMQGSVAPGCAGTFGDIQRVANQIRSAVVSLDEAARQADVYPGTRREALRRHRLDYPAWTR
jgi:S1-C subfamily serine protease